MRKMFVFIIVCVTIIAKEKVTGLDCIPRKYNHESIVCVCNETYCDTWRRIRAPQSGFYAVWTTSSDGLRAQKSLGKFDTPTGSEGVQCIIDSSKPLQKVMGFGGAFTDSAGLNIMALSEGARVNLMRSYFSERGLQYNFGRVPIGGTDFSTRAYTNDDNINDYLLNSFALQPEDLKYKIPLMQEALNLTGNSLEVLATVWSPPAWMKTNDSLTGLGLLKSGYGQQLAVYIKKFIDAYKENGINISYVTPGNEPLMGLSPFNKLNALGAVPNLQADWIAKNLGPTLRYSYPDVGILIGDDQRATLPWWPRTIMDNNDASQYVNGIAVHWYLDTLLSPSLLDQTHDLYPNLSIINTEACILPTPTDPDNVALGSWLRAENYALGIIEDLNHWVAGWIDWNIALDTNGGPNWIQNFVDSPAIINATANEFYKQPMHYILGHFSKFCIKDSQIINHTCADSTVKMISCLRPSGEIAVIILNTDSGNKSLTLSTGNNLMKMNLTSKSITSSIFKS